MNIKIINKNEKDYLRHLRMNYKNRINKIIFKIIQI